MQIKYEINMLSKVAIDYENEIENNNEFKNYL